MIGHVVNQVLGAWGYYAVFAGTALEGFGLFFIPGETILIAAAIISATAKPPQDTIFIGWVLVAALCGGLIGDNFSFWIGRLFGFPALNRYGHYIRLNKKRIKFVQYLYLRHGRPIVFVGRFVVLLRAWESFLAGANAMSWRQFAPTNAAAIVVWVAVWGLSAWGIGHAAKSILEPFIIGIFIVICIILIVGWVYFRRHEDEYEARSEKALPGPLRARPPGSKAAAAAKSSAGE